MGDKKDIIRVDTILKIPDEIIEDIPVGILDLIFQKETKRKIVLLGIAKYYELKAKESEDKKIGNERKRKARKILNFIEL